MLYYNALIAIIT